MLLSQFEFKINYIFEKGVTQMRPQRGQQYSYMSQNDYEQHLRKQIEEKKLLQMQEKVQNQHEIINHYKNNQFGGDAKESDLQHLVQSKERELQQYEHLRSRQTPGSLSVFQGDMNELTKNKGIGGSQIMQQSFERPSMGPRPDLLFSDDFLKNYRGQEVPMNPVQQQQRNNENMNIINGIFGNPNVGPNNNIAIVPGALSQQVADSERERRLKLREMERMKRVEGLSGGDYGQVQQVSHQAQPTSGSSKREQVWQEKMQQRAQTTENSYRPPQMGQLPIYQKQLSTLNPQEQHLDQSASMHQSDSQVRSSRVHALLSDAIKLDQSLNYQDFLAMQQNQAKQQAQVSQQKPVSQQSNPLFGGDDNLIKVRRDVDRQQRQKEYQEYLIKQNQQPYAIPSQPVSSAIPQSRQSIPILPSTVIQQQHTYQKPEANVLQTAGGLNLLGMHQLKKEEDKSKMQREYKQMLDSQTAAHKEVKDQGVVRRKELSDQVFQEIMSRPQEHLAVQKVETPASSNVQGNYFKHQSEDDVKRLEQDKKRQYAIQLQQQMADQKQKSFSSESDTRRRRGGSIQQPHQQAQPEPVNRVFEYQHSQQFEPIQQMPLYSNAPQNYYGMPENQYYPPQVTQSLPQEYQIGNNFSQPQVIQQQQPQMYGFQPGMQHPEAESQQQHAQKQKQDDYRRELEQQIRIKEEQKKQRNHQEKLIDEGMPSRAFVTQDVQRPPEFAQNMAPQPNFVRQRTDVRGGNGNITTIEEDHNDRKSRQQQYQEELQKQVDERKRLKEEDKRKQLIEDEKIERRMQSQQHELKEKESQDLAKEGRVVKEEKKRNVRRDLFETSNDNPTAVANRMVQPPKKEEWQQPQQVQQRPNVFEMPPQPRQDDLYGNAPSFRGFEVKAPEQQIYQPTSQNQQYQMQPPAFSMPPHQFSQAPPQFSMPPPQFNQPPPQVSMMMEQQQFSNEYGGMISMYQKAFQEVIDFKNQYMEEVIRMREQVIREREEILEYEKVKQQQNLEIQNLKAVYDRLGDMLGQEDPRMRQMQNQSSASINPTVQSNLNTLLMKQQQDILRLSQSGVGVSQSLQQRNPFQQTQQPIIEANYYKSKPHLENSPNILEQSLSSDTKFVVVPQNRLGAIAQVAASTQLTQTWKEEQLLMPPPQRVQQKQPEMTLTQLQQFSQSISESLQGSSQFITGHNQTPQKGPLPTSSKMIPTQSAVKQQFNIPEPIQEMPSHQEDDQINISKLQAQRVVKNDEENDFNSRESSKSRDGNEERPHDHRRDKHILVKNEASMYNLTKLSDESNDLTLDKRPSNQINLMMTVDTNPLGNTINENLEQIDKILSQQQTVPKAVPMKAQYSGAIPVSLQIHTESIVNRKQSSEMKSITSPANSSVHMQKTQQKTQERFHNAGATGSSFYNATMHLQKQQEQSQQEELQKQLMRIFGPSTITPDASVQAPVVQKTEYYSKNILAATQDSEEFMLQDNINIADSMNEETATKHLEQFTYLNKARAQQSVQYQPQKVEIEEEAKEVMMNEKPIYVNTYGNSSKFQQSAQIDIWNDPDLIPPPVALIEEQYEESEPIYYPHNNNMDFDSIPQDGMKYPIGYGSIENTSMNAGTINQLQMFSPPSHVEEEDPNHSRINLGTYNQEQFAQKTIDEQMQKPNFIPSPIKKPPMSAKARPPSSKAPQGFQLNLLHPQGYETAKTQGINMIDENESQGGAISDRSLSKKERDIIEIAKLIQKATDTTNTLFENTDHFKFRFKKGATEEFAEEMHQKKQQLNNIGGGQRRNIKTGDPFKNAVTYDEPSLVHIEEDQDKDNHILSGLDRMIQNLQEQKRGEPIRSYTQDRIQIANVDESQEEQHDPIAELKRDAASHEGIRIKKELIKFARPTSGQYQQSEGSQIYKRPISSLKDQEMLSGNQSQMSMKQIDNKSNNQQKSQRSLGKFAQMAVSNADEKMIEEVSRKYGNSRGSLSPDDVRNPVILRPVSGKSNSNRYCHIDANRDNLSSRSKGRSTEKYFDDEEDQ